MHCVQIQGGCEGEKWKKNVFNLPFCVSVRRVNLLHPTLFHGLLMSLGRGLVMQ